MADELPKSGSTEIFFLDLMEKRERLESRRTAAEALGVHPQHLYNLEKQRSSSSLSLAVRAVRRYGPLRLISAEDGAVFLLKEVSSDDQEDNGSEAHRHGTTARRRGRGATRALEDLGLDDLRRAQR